MKAELIPVDGGAPIPITRDVTLVGRRADCDIQIDHPSLSKRHCLLVKTDGLLVIRDLATTNGTKVKGQKIRWAALLPEDRISFGAAKFRVYLGPDHVPSPSEVAARGGNGSGVSPVSPPSAPSAKGSTPAPRPKREDDLPPLELDAGAWRDPMGSPEEEIIELD